MELEEIHATIDKLQAEIELHEPANCPVYHIFTPMLYTRHIFMPAGTLIVSKIHKYEHPFDIMKGIVWVKINNEDWVKFEGPYSGITKAGTRRVLFVETDCWWKTAHVTDVQPEGPTDDDLQEAVGKVEDIIIIKRNELNFKENKVLEHA